SRRMKESTRLTTQGKPTTTRSPFFRKKVRAKVRPRTVLDVRHLAAFLGVRFASSVRQSCECRADFLEHTTSQKARDSFRTLKTPSFLAFPTAKMAYCNSL